LALVLPISVPLLFTVHQTISSLLKKILLLLVLAAAPMAVRAQDIATWQSYTSMDAAVDIAVSGTDVWVATEGGVFNYDAATGSIRTFTVVDGLSGVATTSIAVDSKRSAVWVGYSDGTLDRILSDTGVIQRFRDIERADQFSDRGINRIVVRGDSVLVATEFGVVVFDPIRLEVRDSYSRIGSFSAATPVRDVHIESSILGVPTLWVATKEGIAWASMTGANLQDPGVWTTETQGLFGNTLSVLSLESIGTTLYAGTERDLFQRDQNANYSPFNLTSQKVTHLSEKDGVVIGAAEFRVLVVTSGVGWKSVGVQGVGFPRAVAFSTTGKVWIASSDSGVSYGDLPLDSDTLVPENSVSPSGPETGSFTNLSLGPDGDLWAGGANASNTGFHHLNTDGTWTAYSEATSPILVNKSRFLHAFGASDGSGWVGSEGAGVAYVSPTGELTLYNESNSSLFPATGTADFIIVGGAHEDLFGNMWFTTRGSGLPIHVREVDGEWTGMGPLVGDGLLSRATAYGEIYIDSFDQKWILIHDENSFVRKKGLAVLETGVLTNPSDDSFRFFGTKGAAGVGLPAIEVNAVTEDQDGLVWIGTSSGPAFFVNTGIVARDNSAQPIWPQWQDRSNGTFMLFGLNVNDVAVDPAGRIWFATSEGAWLVESVEGGYAPVHHFTTENSPIFSDEVLSIAVDGESGKVYFSTDKGLISYTSDAVNASDKIVELKVFPNPLRISEGSNPLVFVEGLVASTRVRIVTASGSLVRRLEARGGRLSWDGRDEAGSLVESGVYLVIAVGQNDEGTAYGKIAVIR